LGQLGIANRSINFAEQILPINIGAPVKDIAAGNAHSVFLLQNGTVMVTGSNAQSAVGLASQNAEPYGTTHIRTARAIGLPGPATAICASFYRSFFLVGAFDFNDFFPEPRSPFGSGGEVYGLGCNREGRFAG
jgi:hypothetical protein